MTIESLLSIDPFILEKEKKSIYQSEILSGIFKNHFKNCPEYNKIISTMKFSYTESSGIEDLPFLPVRLFKEYSLKSIPEAEIVKTMTSSGTSGQNLSKIFLDKKTSSNQSKVLIKIISSITGNKRIPMIFMDTESTVKNRKFFSARTAGILGFSIFSKDTFYALDDNMDIKVDELKNFLDKHNGKEILIFGFTFIFWQHFVEKVIKNNLSFDLSQCILIHGGGWKKLLEKKIPNKKFKDTLLQLTGLIKIHDYYGMVEQTGSVYIECEEGHLHASNFSEIIIRDPKTLKVAKVGEKGIIQTISLIPESYPGHSILTEDEGILFGQDDCPCERKGKYFTVLGRIENAEVRGCSDTYLS